MKFKMYVVIRFSDDSLYFLANWEWEVNFFSTGTNMANNWADTLNAASKVTADPFFSHTNDNPAKTVGPIANGNITWL